MTVIEATRQSHPDQALPADAADADVALPNDAAHAGQASRLRGSAGQLHPGRLSAGLAMPSRFRGSAATWRWARRVALAVGGFLVPWCVLLAMTLPRTVQAQNWSLAWVGLDAAEAVAALATAILLVRADARASLTAAAGGVLFTIDAWFDVCTSAPGLDHALALAEAGFLELPLAAAAFWLALTLQRSP